ncbi:hypothetical protein A2J03_27800 [Rhodococcus sp. EPR-157]|uniref:hypothetical protein n=1 Tax=Rhodococcus sp. EPR-157 TaxID=1813677 RepID=UPI0007BBC5D0|nr:hypothetical protein [Rhodococcus sp. EPR-157]KZF03903.1 hypothetical protein A2J03_27800 [Rhodococcus sp. EPR-157]
MGIDTRIDGTPESVHGIADWVAHAVAPRIEGAADAVYASRNVADAGWDGPASDVFVHRTSSTATDVDVFAEAVSESASRLSGAAEALAAALTAMAAARDAASKAGLLVLRDSIAVPILDDLLPAFRAAEDAVGVAREHERRYAQELKDVVDGLVAKWFFIGADMIAAGVEVGTALYSSMLSARAEDLAARGRALIDSAMNAGPDIAAARIYDDYDWGRELTRRADDLTETAADLAARARSIPIKVGGLTAVAEIAYDIYSGTPAKQAVVSGGSGMLATVAAGAVIGTVVGGPVGAALGAGVGAVAGIATSGMVDGVFEDGYESVGDTMADGVGAVQDTGKAIADLTAGAWRSVF